MTDTVERELADHRKAFRAVVAEIEKVPSLGIGSAAVLASVTNALRVASARDPRRLNEREKRTVLDGLGAAYTALLRLAPAQHQVATLTSGFNTMATLAMAWAGDPRWTRGGGTLATVNKIGLAWQLELMATALLDEVAIETNALIESRNAVVARLMNPGILEN